MKNIRNAETVNLVKWILPAAASAGGFAACFLRLMQNRTGFEAETGLPVPGNVPGLLLVLLLAVLCGFLWAASRLLAREQEPDFPFSTENRIFFILPVAGAFVLALGGGADLLEGLGAGNFLTNTRYGFLLGTLAESLFNASYTGIPGIVQIVLGILALLSAGGLLVSCASCRRRAWKERQSRRQLFRREILLIPPVSMLCRTVMVYRMDSIDPILEGYAMELMALLFLSWGCFSLSSYAFESGRLSSFAFTTGCAVVFSLGALSDHWKYLSSPLVLLGGSLCLMGFLLLRLQSREGGPSGLTEAGEAAPEA